MPDWGEIFSKVVLLPGVAENGDIDAAIKVRVQILSGEH